MTDGETLAMGLNLIIKNLLNMHSRLAAAQAEFAAAHPSLAAAQAEEQPENVWQVLTSYRAMLAYAIILMVAVAAIMMLLIVRSARDVKQREAEKRKREARRRFSRLAQLDSEAEKRGKVNQPKYEGDLERFCDDFRNFAAANMGLYYDIATIRAFVASLSVTRLIILQGISGTGKTSLPYAFGKYVGNEAAIVPVQPSWKDKTDMLGYYNEFTDSFTETELLYKLYEANLSGDLFTVVLDEMNIARVEYYFAEFLSLLELPDPAARQIEVVSSRRESDPKLLKNGRLLVPENVWFVGTANNDDSTLAISDKVYDRAMVLELSRRAEPFNAVDPGVARISFARIDRLFKDALEANWLSLAARKKIEELDAYLIEKFQLTFGNRIMRQTERFVPVYLDAGGSETEAIDLILCKKVLRKLENLNPVLVETRAAGLLEKLNALFGEGTMPLCAEYISRYIRS